MPFVNPDAEAIWTQLTRIADSLEILAAAVCVPEAPPAATTPEPCSHPIETRISFGQTSGQADWECGTCGYRTVPA